MQTADVPQFDPTLSYCPEDIKRPKSNSASSNSWANRKWNV